MDQTKIITRLSVVSAAVLFFFIFLPFSLIASDLDATKIKISNNLNQMVATWNKGDIATFVKSYKNSDSTIYISSTVIHGYQNVVKRYLMHYPTRDAMGILSVSDLEIKILSPQYAVVIGHWSLKRKTDKNMQGIFTLLYENTTNGWKIILDHTSS